MRYARIEDGVVREIGEFPSIEGRFHPSLVWVKIPQDQEVGEGWSYQSGEFLPPPEPQEPEPGPPSLEDRLAAVESAILELAGI